MICFASSSSAWAKQTPSNMSIYQIGKGKINIIDVANYYGIATKGSKALCPFHKERTPSLSFKGDYFKCFGCGEKGDMISFVSKLFDIPPFEALKKLNKDFSLGLDISNPNSVQNYRANMYKWEKELQTCFDQWVSNAVNALIKHIAVLKTKIFKHAPKTYSEKLDPLFIDGINSIDYYEYLLDMLACGSDWDKLSVYKNDRKEVEKIERKQRY